MVKLLSFMDLQVEFISAPGLLVIRNLLRHFPQLFSRVKNSLQRLFPTLTDSESLTSSLWIIGQFGQEIEEAPYLLETFIDNRESDNVRTSGETSQRESTISKLEHGYHSTIVSQSSVLLELLYACLKLFLTRAPEMQKSLGKLFNLVSAKITMPKSWIRTGSELI